jgi:hypothetical protein
MWCTRDAEDVQKGRNLKYDQQWGWIHRKDGDWHTLGGTDLEISAVDGSLRTRIYTRLIAPLRRGPSLARRRS